MNDLESRIGKLERANRRLRGAALGMFVAVVAALVMGAARPAEPTDVIRAKRFEVVNDLGAVLAILGASDGGGSVTVLDAQGRRLFTASGAKDPRGDLDGAVSVFGNAHELVRLSVGETDVGTIRTLDADGKELVKLATMTEDGVNKGCGAVIVADPTRQTWPGILTTQRAVRRR